MKKQAALPAAATQATYPASALATALRPFHLVRRTRDAGDRLRDRPASPRGSRPRSMSRSGSRPWSPSRSGRCPTWSV